MPTDPGLPGAAWCEGGGAIIRSIMRELGLQAVQLWARLRATVPADDLQGVGKVGSGAWLGDELDGSFWAS